MALNGLLYADVPLKTYTLTLTGKRWPGVGGHALVSGCPEHSVSQPHLHLC